jgi:hypothetical protein
VTDFLETGGQDVLEEAADELQRIQRHLPRTVRSDATIGERDLTFVAGDDPMVADRHTEDVRSKVVQRGPAIAGGLSVHHPVATPHCGIDQLQQTFSLQEIPELCPEDHRQSLDRDEKVGPRRQPARAVGAEAAARHHVVHVRVILQRPAPGMQYAEEADAIGTDELRVC